MRTGLVAVPVQSARAVARGAGRDLGMRVQGMPEKVKL